MKWRLFTVFSLLFAGEVFSQTPGDKMLADYFESQTELLADRCLAEIQSAEDWARERGNYREQLFEMLGIPSRLERPPLEPEVTGSQEHDGIVIENVVFQSLPGLYVTANLYRPAGKIEQPLPAILYVCGHSTQKAAGISLGNKTGYHHHGVWFAKNGYACLMIDTIQLGEIGGVHHGTYRYGRWWWNSRGYTPAGVEAWNGIRALDYLQARPEVDPERIGMTGRSGGGAYTWWVSALDERVKVAVPVAGITNLHNHVVDGVVEGHCDCMFHVNTYRWDFAQVAALVAPRPLLIANTDNDSIFPLDGVVEVHKKVRRIYELLGAGDNIGLAITEGPHKDTQPLRTVAFEWFERHLKGLDRDAEFDARAPKVLDRVALKVLKEIPEDEVVTKIDESFVARAAAPKIPQDAAEWEKTCEGWMEDLRDNVFRGWPQKPCELNVREVGAVMVGGSTFSTYEFDSQPGVKLHLSVAWGTAEVGEHPVRFLPVDEKGLEELKDSRYAAVSGDATVVVFCPRGIGRTAWTDDARKRVHIRRRFMLLGQTLDGMRVWDIRRAIAATRQIAGLSEVPITIEAERKMAANALYASLFEDGIGELRLSHLAPTHQAEDAVDYLNILRYLDTPAVVAMASEKCRISLRETGNEPAWQFPKQVAKKLGKRLEETINNEEP